MRFIQLQKILSKSVSNSCKMNKYNVVFVLGPPGSGKGTQCSKIVEAFGFTHLSAGDLLREERYNPGSKFGELIENHIKNGIIVPNEITCSLLERAMKESGRENFLIDGYPRNEDNLHGWNKEMGNKTTLKFVLYFDCPLEVCTERCLSRGLCGSGRTDDNKESLKKRFNTYMQSTMGVINHYKNLELVRKVGGVKSADEVFSDVKKHFLT